MAFNEQNTVEHFIIHQLTGVNLNAVQGNLVKEDDPVYDTVKWKYVQADLLQRDITEVFVEKELKAALCRLNPDIAAQPDRADGRPRAWATRTVHDSCAGPLPNRGPSRGRCL